MVFFKEQSIRYLFAGATNTLIGFIIYTGLLYLTDIPYWLANFFSVVIATISGYYLSSEFVFRDKVSARKNTKLKYVITLVAQYLLSTFILWLLIAAGLSETWAYVGMLPVAIAFSFVLQKFWVFHTSQPTENRK